MSKSVKAKRLGDIQKVINSKPHWADAASYNHIRVQFPNGDERSLLFTDKDIQKALDRAKKNPEDIPTWCWFRDIFD